MLEAIQSSLKNALTPIHPEGWRFVTVFAVVTVLAFWLLPDVFGWLGVALTGWCAWFFRDPERVTPQREGLVIAPADGRIVSIAEATPPPELDLDPTARVRIGIFMSVFDVHIQRAPVSGVISGLVYVPGKFVNADLDKASEHNERQAFTVKMEDGTKVGFVQIAGLIARRIMRFVERGDRVWTGQRVGLIRFGSRVDVWLPPGVKPLVLSGQRTIAGETVLADLKGRDGEGA
ncbi:MAG TPA: phosphatidylserine decarboxylase [Thermopetrobacter sp.]|nr:phosphatidylserine decarboxylase [Thermopetrobacter sp.]